jgi:hypothetical protein
VLRHMEYTERGLYYVSARSPLPSPTRDRQKKYPGKLPGYIEL